MTFDLDAFIAEQASAAGPFEFEFGGQTFTTVSSQPDIRVAVLLDRGDVNACLRAMLGDEQYNTLVSCPALLTHAGLVELLRQWAAHGGSSVGESSASPASSPATAKRSRQTSSSTSKRR